MFASCAARWETEILKGQLGTELTVHNTCKADFWEIWLYQVFSILRSPRGHFSALSTSHWHKFSKVSALHKLTIESCFLRNSTLWGRLSALSTSHRHKFSKVSVLVNSVHKLTIDSRFLRNSQKSARSSIDYINWLLRVGFWEILALGGHLSALSTSHWSKFSTSSALLNWLHKTESTKLDFEQF